MAENVARIEAELAVRGKDEMSGTLDKISKSTDKLVAGIEKISATADKMAKHIASTQQGTLNSINSSISHLGTTLNNVSRQVDELNTRLSKVGTQAVSAFSEADRSAQSLVASLMQTGTGASRVFTEANAGTVTLRSGLRDLVAGMGTYQSAQSGFLTSLDRQFTTTAAGLYTLLRYIRQITGVVERMDAIQASYGRIMGASVGQTYIGKATNQMMDDSIALAYRYGASIEDVAGVMVEFARQGRSQNEIRYLTQSLAELRLMLATSTGSFMDMHGAMKSATTLMNQMDISVEKAVDGLKLIAEYDIRAATSFDQISTALNRFAAAGKVANMSLDEMVQTATAFTEIGIGGARAGTALNTIISRVQNTKKAQEMLGELGISMTVLENGTYRATSAFEQLLEAYRKVMSSGNTALIRRFGQTFAGTRMQSTMFAGLSRLDKQSKAEVTASEAADILAKFQASMQSKLDKHPIKAGIRLRTETTAVDIPADEVQQKIRAGLEKLTASMQDQFKLKNKLTMPDMPTQVREWFDFKISRSQANSIIKEYSSLFEDINASVLQTVEKLEAPYDRFARMARAETEDLRAERERALETMSNTLVMQKARLKAVFESEFLTADVTKVFSAGIEKTIDTVRVLASTLKSTLGTMLTTIGFGDMERGVRNLGRLIDFYLGSRLIKMFWDIAQAGTSAFSRIAMSLTNLMSRVNVIRTSPNGILSGISNLHTWGDPLSALATQTNAMSVANERLAQSLLNVNQLFASEAKYIEGVTASMAAQAAKQTQTQAIALSPQYNMNAGWWKNGGLHDELQAANKALARLNTEASVVERNLKRINLDPRLAEQFRLQGARIQEAITSTKNYINVLNGVKPVVGRMTTEQVTALNTARQSWHALTGAAATFGTVAKAALLGVTSAVLTVVTFLGNVLAIIGIVTTAWNLATGWWKSWTEGSTKAAMKAKELAASMDDARRSLEELRKTQEAYQKDQESLEFVLGQNINSAYRSLSSVSGLKAMVDIAIKFSPKFSSKDQAEARKAIDKAADQYAAYLDEYTLKANQNGLDWIKSNPVQDYPTWLMDYLEVDIDKRAQVYSMLETIFKAMNINFQEMIKQFQTNLERHLINSEEAAARIKDIEKQITRSQNLIANNQINEVRNAFQAEGEDRSSLWNTLKSPFGFGADQMGMIREMKDTLSNNSVIAAEVSKYLNGISIENATYKQLTDAWLAAISELSKSNASRAAEAAELLNQAAVRADANTRTVTATEQLAKSTKELAEKQENLKDSQAQVEAMTTVKATDVTESRIKSLESRLETMKRDNAENEERIADLQVEYNDAKADDNKEAAKEAHEKIIAAYEEEATRAQEQLDILHDMMDELVNTYFAQTIANLIQLDQESLALIMNMGDHWATIDEIMAEFGVSREEAIQMQEENQRRLTGIWDEIDKIAQEYQKAMTEAGDDAEKQARAKQAALKSINILCDVLNSMIRMLDETGRKAVNAIIKTLRENMIKGIESGAAAVAKEVAVATAAGTEAGQIIEKESKRAANALKNANRGNQAQRRDWERWSKPKGGGGRKRRGGGGGANKAEKDLLQQLASEHAERMSALEIAFRTIKDSEGNIIEYLDRTGTVDYMRAQIEEIKHYEQELAKVLSKLKDPKDIAKVKKDIEKAALQRVKLEWEIQLKLNAAKKQEVEHEIDLLKKRADMNVDLFGAERRNELLDQIYAKEKEIHDMKMSEAKGDPIKERAEQIAWENKLLSRQEQIVKNITSDLKKQIDLQNKSNPLEEYDRQFRQSNPQYFTAAHKHLEYGLNNIAGALESGTQKIQQNMESFTAKIAEQRRAIESNTELSDAGKKTALDQLKAQSIDGFKSVLASADKEIKEALDNFNMDRILPGQKIHDPILGKTFGTSFRDRKELLEKAKETIDQKIEEITQMFRDAGFSESEINSAELQEMIRSYGDKYAEYFKKELEALDKSRQMMMDEIKSALTSGWEEGFNIGIEHGFTEEGYKALLKNMKMTVAKSVSQGIQRLIADQMTQAITSFFNDTMDGVGSILGQSLGGILAPMISGLIGNVIGFLIGGLFSDWVNEMEEEQLKQQRDAINAQGFTWSYQDPSTATPYYEFSPPVSSESVKIVKFNSTFNITTDAALAMASHRRELERVVTELFTAWTREASKVIGARV